MREQSFAARRDQPTAASAPSGPLAAQVVPVLCVKEFSTFELDGGPFAAVGSDQATRAKRPFRPSDMRPHSTFLVIRHRSVQHKRTASANSNFCLPTAHNVYYVTSARTRSTTNSPLLLNIRQADAQAKTKYALLYGLANMHQAVPAESAMWRSADPKSPDAPVSGPDDARVRRLQARTSDFSPANRMFPTTIWP